MAKRRRAEASITPRFGRIKDLELPDLGVHRRGPDTTGAHTSGRTELGLRGGHSIF